MAFSDVGNDESVPFEKDVGLASEYAGKEGMGTDALHGHLGKSASILCHPDSPY